jgi:hypothetical protein
MDYRSSARLLGSPLVHIAVGAADNESHRRGVAAAWIAIGDVAIGVLFACGGVAVGAISLGGAAFGMLPMGGFALGLVVVAGIGLGVVAVGGVALAWYAAIGGLALAHDYAIGGIAWARRVIIPPSSGSRSISSIPHAPFHWSDALLLVLIAGALLLVARTVHARGKE